MAKGDDSGIGGGAKPQYSYTTPDPNNPTANGFKGTVDGKDISGSWKPPSVDSTGAEQIESVMDAQGFRDMPKLISDQKEFNKAARAAWGGNGMVMVRGIGAPDDATLQAYSDTLTHGEWYVSCGGGAVHGYGQYAAYRYGSFRTLKSMRDEAEMYARGNGRSTKLFVMTLDPSAKIGEERTLRTNMESENQSAISGSKRAQSIINNLKGNSNLSRGEQAALRHIQNGELKAFNYGSNAGAYYDDHDRIIKSVTKALNSDGKRSYSDTGVYAAAKGYDFYYDRSTGYSVTLNRSKLIIKV